MKLLLTGGLGHIGSYFLKKIYKIKKIKAPTLIIHGRHDPMIQLKNAYKMHKLMPHSQLEIIDNMRHLIEPEILSQFEEVLLGHLRKVN